MTGAPQTLVPRIRPPPAALARLPDSRPQSYACTGLAFHSTPSILNNPTLTLPWGITRLLAYSTFLCHSYLSVPLLKTRKWRVLTG